MVTSSWPADSARGAAAVARADSAEARLAAARSVARAQQTRTAELEVELAEVATLADTARVQAAIIVSQQETILGLSVSLEDAQEFLRDARMDLAMANEDRQEVVAENQRLQAVIRAGIEATKPSRGGGWCESRCPSVGVDYNASSGGVLAGVDVPLTKYVRAGVRWEVGR